MNPPQILLCASWSLVLLLLGFSWGVYNGFHTVMIRSLILKEGTTSTYSGKYEHWAYNVCLIIKRAMCTTVCNTAPVWGLVFFRSKVLVFFMWNAFYILWHFSCALFYFTLPSSLLLQIIFVAFPQLLLRRPLKMDQGILVRSGEECLYGSCIKGRRKEL